MNDVMNAGSKLIKEMKEVSRSKSISLEQWDNYTTSQHIVANNNNEMDANCDKGFYGEVMLNTAKNA